MENKLTFIDTKHEEFYEKHGAEGDSYKKSFVYLIGLTEDTRNHYPSIFSEGGINREVINEGWLTGETTRLLILAFNLWNGYKFGYSDPINDEKNLEDMSKDELVSIVQSGFNNSVDQLFLGELGYYYLQGVNLRFNLDKKEASRQQFAEMIEHTLK